jgi:ankyrin repeat protein
LFLKVLPRSLQGKTALLQAAGRGDVAIVQVLVAAKANLEAEDVRRFFHFFLLFRDVRVLVAYKCFLDVL